MAIKLQEKYQKEVIPKMMEKFGYKSVMAVPKIEKVVINTGFGRQVVGKGADETRKFIDFIVGELALISGQKPVLTKAKKAIASFKTRQGMVLGAKVTLRKKKMTDFLERVINLALPRTRDFAGLPAGSVDQGGNLSLAVKEYIVFPEITQEKARNIFSLEITVVTNARSKEEGLELLKLLGFPIKV